MMCINVENINACTSITMPNQVFVMLEKARGRITRSRFIADIIEEYLRREEAKKK